MPKSFYILLIVFCFVMRASVAVSHNNAAFDSAWLKLLHYKETFGGDYIGLISNPEFYVDANGRYNPQAEMEKEISLFNSGDMKKCDFPARFEYLKKQGVVTGDLSECNEYQEFIKDVKPNGITLLFTDAFMSNPASMFGHTLIRIDTARKGTQMLAHGSNFGADSGDESGIIFAVKGLFGGYYGSYTVNPYWDIINTYNNIENRDIWEYHLNLTPEEQQKFVNHLYEMKNARIQYFFMTKNCSYMILELIEAVRPNINLTTSYNYYAIPLDTLKSVKEIPDLIDDVNYRPARYTKLQAQVNNMNQKQLRAFKEGIKNHDYNMKDLNEQEKSLVLEAEYQYYQYMYTTGDMELQEYRKNSFAVLRKRSSISEAADIKIDGQDPTLSHSSFQIALSTGVYDKRSFEQINIRPAYTGITDYNYGLIKGAGISAFDTWLRYYNQSHKFVLQRFTVLKLDSLVPSDSVFSRWSYSTNLNVHREYNPKNNKEGYVGEFAFSFGKTYEAFEWLWLYATLGGVGQYGGIINKNQWGGVVPGLGVFGDFGRIKTNVAIEKIFASQGFGKRLIYKSEISYNVDKDVAVAILYNVSHNEIGRSRQEIMGQMRYSF